MKPKVKITDAKVLPVCPHCEKEIDEIQRMVIGVMQPLEILMCPNCKKIIGSDRY